MVQTHTTINPLRAETVDTQFDSVMTGAANQEQLLREVMERLGGPHAALEQLSAVLERGRDPAQAGVDESTPGYCYLRLFDRVEHRDAIAMGCRPTVADVRRFSNGRADPFGTRLVVVNVHKTEFGRLAHFQYSGGAQGLRPVEALAALSKDCVIGGLPDGVSEEFPPSWIPAKLQAAQTWDYLRDGETVRSLDILAWLGANPTWLDPMYEPLTAATTKMQWNLRANPLGPPTSTIDVVDPQGRVSVVRTWTSYVAHTGYHQDFKVRGNKVFTEVLIWRAAKVLSDPRSPAPAPTPDPRHGDLLLRVQCGNGRVAANDIKVLSSANLDDQGYCYSSAFSDPHDAAFSLGAYPTVAAVKAYARRIKMNGNEGVKKAWLVGDGFLQAGTHVHHVQDHAVPGCKEFWSNLESLHDQDLVGATQSDAVRSGRDDNVSLPATLAIRPRAAGTLLTVPFVAILGTGKEILHWNISSGKKFAMLASYFESVELVSLRAKVTVHRGDNDTMVTLVADSVDHPLSDEIDWVGAAHTLHVSGNTNGATTGELVLEGNHGFGTQLKGAAVGNPTPIIQAKLETAVVATAYIKFQLTVRVAGTGIPVAMALPTRAAKGGINGVPRGGRAAGSDDDDD